MFSFAECAQAEGGDGRSEFALTSSGQLKMPRLGNYCVTFLGDAALANAAATADASATSSDSQHTVDQLTDGDAVPQSAGRLRFHHQLRQLPSMAPSAERQKRTGTALQPVM